MIIAFFGDSFTEGTPNSVDDPDIWPNIVGKHFEAKDIMDKERTLRHMLKPNTWKEIKTMILNAGFQDVQCFWSNHLFVGALAIK